MKEIITILVFVITVIAIRRSLVQYIEVIKAASDPKKFVGVEEASAMQKDIVSIVSSITLFLLLYL